MTIKHLCLAASLLISTVAGARQRFSFLGKTVVLEDSLGAALANSRSDAYTASQTPFDRSIRLHTETATTEQDYLNTAAKSMRNWSPEEIAALKISFSALAATATELKLRIPLPDSIVVCKTTAHEELGAEGYTRGNRIMLHVGTGDLSPGLLSHELWHVISRLNPVLRDRAYAGFGFRPCNRIDYKPAFKGQVITNPDCPFLEHYININKDGKSMDATLVLYSRIPYTKGGGLMQYAAVGLMELEGDEAHKHPLLRGGKPVLHDVESCEDFFRQAGHNSGYMLHIEELTAEHFSALMTGKKLRETEFVEQLEKVLR